MLLRADDPLALSLRLAIRSGHLRHVEELLGANAELISARIIGRRGGSRQAIHMVADWPGFFANGPQMVRLLVSAGADVNSQCEGAFTETALHGAASSDDREVAEALIQAGANLEVSGGSIAGGTPLDNAVGYGCWQVARLLVDRGARVDRLWVAAAMGLLDRVRELVETDPPPSQDEIGHAFYQACSGAQHRTAEYLLAHGADINFTPDYARNSTPLSAATGLETRRQTIAEWLKDHGAR